MLYSVVDVLYFFSSGMQLQLTFCRVSDSYLNVCLYLPMLDIFTDTLAVLCSSGISAVAADVCQNLWQLF